jgi:hypothetical protein
LDDSELAKLEQRYRGTLPYISNNPARLAAVDNRLAQLGQIRSLLAQKRIPEAEQAWQALIGASAQSSVAMLQGRL